MFKFIEKATNIKARKLYKVFVLKEKKQEFQKKIYIYKFLCIACLVF